MIVISPNILSPSLGAKGRLTAFFYNSGGYMGTALKETVISHFRPHVSAIGFASVERFHDAPEKHRPTDVCKDARTVIVFGIPVPQGVLSSPCYNLHTLHRSYHTIYRHLDELSHNLCTFIESQGNYRSVPVPSYAPMVFHGVEPWGIISLKHAAVRAGLGVFGRSDQVYHPRYGSRLRLSAVITNAEIPADDMIGANPCPPKCNACRKACPSGAFDDRGSFKKLICLGHTIKHAIYPLALKDQAGLKNIERVVNTAGYDYWIACDECLTVCPNNRETTILDKGENAVSE
jgi:epoxyqueuosine reductase QueG